MKPITRILASALIIVLISTGCVPQSTYDKFVAQTEYQLEILACEAQGDAWEEETGRGITDPTRRDEPLGTRRDEPLGTRRDLKSCRAELAGTVDNHYPVCRPKLQTCMDDTELGVPQCQQCFDTCMTSVDGTWPDTVCDIEP